MLNYVTESLVPSCRITVMYHVLNMMHSSSADWKMGCDNVNGIELPRNSVYKTNKMIPLLFKSPCVPVTA